MQLPNRGWWSGGVGVEGEGIPAAPMVDDRRRREARGGCPVTRFLTRARAHLSPQPPSACASSATAERRRTVRWHPRCPAVHEGGCPRVGRGAEGGGGAHTSDENPRGVHAMCQATACAGGASTGDALAQGQGQGASGSTSCRSLSLAAAGLIRFDLCRRFGACCSRG